MISGLSGLDEVLAWLPFLECCIPCTMEVCLWWPYEDAVRGLTTRSKKLSAAERGAEGCARTGERDLDEDFAMEAADCRVSREESLECAMYRAVCGPSSPALTVRSQSSSSSFMGDRGENLRAS